MITNELKKVIKSQLDTITGSGKTYIRRAEKNAIYPHKVFNVESVDLNNAPREDFILTVDVWTKDANTADNIADEVKKIFDSANLPNTAILPTFYLLNCRPIEDDDATIERRQVKFQCQIYEREVASNAQN